MSKPQDISTEIWDAAVRCTGIGGGHEFAGVLDAQRQTIARAIMSAEKRGEEREREACAAFIRANMLCGDDGGGEVLLPRSNPGNKVGFAYADAILKRGEG